MAILTLFALDGWVALYRLKMQVTSTINQQSPDLIVPHGTTKIQSFSSTGIVLCTYLIYIDILSNNLILHVPLVFLQRHPSHAPSTHCLEQ